jgi:hypothetical protein
MAIGAAYRFPYTSGSLPFVVKLTLITVFEPAAREGTTSILVWPICVNTFAPALAWRESATVPFASVARICSAAALSQRTRTVRLDSTLVCMPDLNAIDRIVYTPSFKNSSGRVYSCPEEAGSDPSVVTLI